MNVPQSNTININALTMIVPKFWETYNLTNVPQSWYIQRFAHERAPDIVIIPDFESVILDEGKQKPNFPFYHGPPYPPDVSIWCVFSGAGVKKLGRVGDMLDYSSRETISEQEIESLPEQASIAPTVKAIWGIEG